MNNNIDNIKKKPDVEDDLDKMKPTEQAQALTEERMVANIRDNFYDSTRVLWLAGEINDEEQFDIIKWLHFYNDKSKKPVTIIINTFGGSIYTMYAIIDLIEELKKNDIVVNTVCLGAAMSAGAVILSSGTPGHRYVSPNSTVMIHSIQSFMMDQHKAKDVGLHAKFTERSQTRFENILANYTGKSVKQIKKAVEYETYLFADEAVEFGLADSIDTLIV